MDLCLWGYILEVQKEKNIFIKKLDPCCLRSIETLFLYRTCNVKIFSLEISLFVKLFIMVGLKNSAKTLLSNSMLSGKANDIERERE